MKIQLQKKMRIALFGILVLFSTCASALVLRHAMVHAPVLRSSRSSDIVAQEGANSRAENYAAAEERGRAALEAMQEKSVERGYATADPSASPSVQDNQPQDDAMPQLNLFAAGAALIAGGAAAFLLGGGLGS